LPKNYFIGAGLSAYFAQLLHAQQEDVCLYPSANLSPFSVRRPQLEINKLFAGDTKSMGSNHYQLTNVSLHDRPVPGGNSGIWGGFFDMSQVHHADKLMAAGVHLVPLSFDVTGSVSNIQSLVQLQDSNGGIFNATNHLRAGTSSYLNSIRCESGQVTLKCLSADASKESEVTCHGKVFVCTGVVQTIDVLMRSKFINPGDALTLDEFDYELVLAGEPVQRHERDACVISYTPGRAAAHLLGIQKANSLTSLKPFAIHQVFHARKKTMHMVAGDHVLIAKSHSDADGTSTSFGKSIHYCNLKINGERLVDLARRLSPNLHFVGMGSVSQKTPGPISSDIFGYLEKIGNEL